jgi:prophage regulatory protein
VVAVAEVAQMLDVGKARAHQLVLTPDFPAPVAKLSVGKLWLRSDVQAWARQMGRTVHPISSR